MPMMEKAIENLEFSVSELSVWREKDNMVSHYYFISSRRTSHEQHNIKMCIAHKKVHAMILLK